MIYSSYDSKTTSSIKTLSLGNLGQSEAICSIVKFGLNRNLIECQTGLITSIESFGLLEAQTKPNVTLKFFDGLFFPKDKGRRCMNKPSDVCNQVLNHIKLNETLQESCVG